MANANDKQWQKDAADQNFDYMFKLLIIGNSAVGKTSFLFRYADDSFTSAFVSTVGIDFKVKTVFRNDKRVKLQIWDTGRFPSISNRCRQCSDVYSKLMALSYSWTGKISDHNDCILSWERWVSFSCTTFQTKSLSKQSRTGKTGFCNIFTLVVEWSLIFVFLSFFFFLHLRIFRGLMRKKTTWFLIPKNGKPFQFWNWDDQFHPCLLSAEPIFFCPETKNSNNVDSQLGIFFVLLKLFKLSLSIVDSYFCFRWDLADPKNRNVRFVIHCCQLLFLFDVPNYCDSGRSIYFPLPGSNDNK